MIEKFIAFIKGLFPWGLKSGVKQALRFLESCFLPKKTIVILLCSMRSGSTLLKALLAEAPDVSHLPETDFRKFGSDPYRFYKRVCRLSAKRIIVLKHPFWFADVTRARIIPRHSRIKVIVLARDVAGTVRSLQRTIPHLTKYGHLSTRELVDYWCDAYEGIWNSVADIPQQVGFVRYEDLIDNPRETTQRLFRFIGSVQEQGVETYQRPGDFEWEWGTDDGGEKIKTLQVLKPADDGEADDGLDFLVEHSPRILQLRKMLGFAKQAEIGEARRQYV